MLKPLVANAAPFFKGTLYNPLKKAFENVSLHDFKGKFLLLNFYPLDFTFVCPTEIVALSNLKKEFEKRNCEVLCCSCDSHFSHKAWCETPKEHGGFNNSLQISLLADFNKTIARDYGVLLEGGVALRGSFLIDPKQVIRHSTVNDLPIGRNMEEFLRLVDAVDFVDKNGEVCPAQWKKQGDPTMKADHDSNKTKSFFKNHFDV